MPSTPSYRFSYQQSLSFLNLLRQHEDIVSIESVPGKFLIRGYSRNSEQLLFSLRLPLVLPMILETESLQEYVDRLPEVIPPYFIFLVQSGRAALGYFDQGEVIHHKVFQRYAVRRKHGKSQVKHLKKKGSKSAGGQLRMRQTQALFEDTNAKLHEWEAADFDGPILYYCSTNLWQFFFSAKTEAPFQRKDQRLRKIPRDIAPPSYEELLNTNRQVCAGWLEVLQQEWQTGTILQWAEKCKE